LRYGTYLLWILIFRSGEQTKETQQGTGKVFYEPDEADDWDDEDPDDDLDI